MPNTTLKIASQDVGGARVLKPNLLLAGKKREVGELLSEDEFNSIRLANRDALVRTGSIMVFPRGDNGASSSNERFLVHRSDGKFDVVQGTKVNPTPLDTKEAADKWLHNTKPRVRAEPVRPTRSEAIAQASVTTANA